jgi:hypothetical protein
MNKVRKMDRFENEEDFLSNVRQEIEREVYDMNKGEIDKKELEASIIAWFKTWLDAVSLKKLNEYSEQYFKAIKSKEEYDEQDINLVFHFTPKGDQYDIEDGNSQSICDASPDNIHIWIRI